MLNLSLYYGDSWEQARGYIKDDLERIQQEFNNHVDQTTNISGGLPSEVIQGDPVGLRYVSDQGSDPVTGAPAPLWDEIHLDSSSGIQGRLPFQHLPTINPGKLLGRENAGSPDDIEEITVGSGLVMTGATLSASGSGITTAQLAARIAGRI